jgi:hypothetical protein
MHHRFQGRLVAGQRLGHGIMRTMAESTFGGGSNAVRRHHEQQRHVVAPLQHHRQAAIRLAARLGHHALDHFLLQHEMLVLHQRREVARWNSSGLEMLYGRLPTMRSFWPAGTGMLREIELQRIARVDVSLAG